MPKDSRPKLCLDSDRPACFFLSCEAAKLRSCESPAVCFTSPNFAQMNPITRLPDEPKFPGAGNFAGNFFSKRQNSADYAQNQQICTGRQGTSRESRELPDNPFPIRHLAGLFRPGAAPNREGAGKKRESGSSLWESAFAVP